MTTLCRLSCFGAICLCVAGCYQSSPIKQEAIVLDHDVLTFKAQKQTEVDKLNQTFQDTSEQLFDQLTILGNELLDLQRDLNSQALADQAVLDPNSVLMPKKMHDSSVDFIEQQFAQIQTVNEQIADARKQYAGSAHTLKLSLDQLTNVHTALQKLIESPTTSDAKTILQYIEGGYDGIKAGVAAAKSPSASSGNGAAAAPKAIQSTPKAPAVQQTTGSGL